MKIEINQGELPADLQKIITNGFSRHTEVLSAPPFFKERLNWLAYNDTQQLVGALTADLLWDWLYIDELWVDENCRGLGLGKNLMQQAEAYAHAHQLSGVWLWTQSWQAESFYLSLGYQEFARFPDFPKGHARIGFRKILSEHNNVNVSYDARR